MIRSRIMFAVFIIFLLIWSLLSKDYLPIFIFGAAIGGLLPLGILTYNNKNKLKISFKINERTVNKNSTVHCTAIGKNTSRLFVPKAVCNIKIKNLTMNDESKISLDFSLGPKSNQEIEFDFESKYCGYIEIKAVELIYEDIFGIFAFKEAIEYKEGLVVIPDTFPCEVGLKEQYVPNYESVTYSEVKKGNDPSETFGVREYSEGDNVKSIHWKLSSKLDNVMVKELGLPIDNSILIIFDLGSLKAKRRAIDTLISTFTSICLGMSAGQLKYTLCFYDYDRADFNLYDVNSADEFIAFVSEVIRRSENYNEQLFINSFQGEDFIYDYAHVVMIAGSEYNEFCLKVSEENNNVVSILYGEEDKEYSNVITYNSQNKVERISNIMI